MKPQNKAILDTHYHIWELFKKQQTMSHLTGSIQNELLRVMREEFQPGYHYDAWCRHCVVRFVERLYTFYDKWKADNEKPIEQPKVIKVRATFPKSKKQ